VCETGKRPFSPAFCGKEQPFWFGFGSQFALFFSDICDIRIHHSVSFCNSVFHRRQPHIGKIQAGVRVALDEHAFARAGHLAAQGVAVGFGTVVFHRFVIARCKIRHRKAGVVGFTIKGTVHLVVAVVAGGSGGDGGGHLNAGEGRPPCDHGPLFDLPAFGSPAHEHVAVDDKGQHAVRGGLLHHLPAAGSAEAEPGVVGELCVLFRELAVAGHLVHTRRIGRHPARPALHQHVGKGHGLEGIQRRQRGGFGCPEGVVVRQGQQQKAFHAPIGAARGVVVFGHVHLRVAVADGQDAVPVKDVLEKPPPEVAHDDALHHRQGQGFQPRPDAGRPEAVLRKAVGQAAAKGQGRTVGVEPVDELLCK